MENWRDLLSRAGGLEIDDETGDLIVNGQRATQEGEMTAYGRAHFIEELNLLSIALKAARAEIEFVERKLSLPEIDDREHMQQIFEKVQRDYAVLLEYKKGTELYLARFAHNPSMEDSLAAILT